MNTNNGGFPPIQFITPIIKDNKIELNNNRNFKPHQITKPVDIKRILSISNPNKMIELNKNNISIIDSF
jgi:hypothetical protein